MTKRESSERERVIREIVSKRERMRERENGRQN